MYSPHADINKDLNKKAIKSLMSSVHIIRDAHSLYSKEIMLTFLVEEITLILLILSFVLFFVQQLDMDSMCIWSKEQSWEFIAQTLICQGQSNC